MRIAFVVLFLICCIVASQGADLDGIDTDVFLPNSGSIESDNTVSCFAAIYPYSTWQPSINSSARQPSSSPVPPYVEGAINFAIFNYGSNVIQAPWTLGVYNPYYTQVLQVWNFDFLNATQGQIYGNASAVYETLNPNRNNTVFLGILVQAALNNIQPQNITVNGQQCRIQLVNNITDVLFFDQDASNGQSAATESVEQPVSVQDGQLIGTDGNPVTMKAINYFGFNNGATMFDGLWAGGNALTQDFGLNLYRIQALGFNCIRVPFSFQNLFKSQPTSFTKTCNQVTQAQIRSNLSPPDANIPSSLPLPTQVFPQGNDPGICNQYLPNDSVYHRFLYVIQFLVRNNFYVLIDDHSEDPTVQNDANLWVTYYTQLMTDITKDVPSRNRVMVDVLNEPDHAGLNWSQLGPLYLAVMDAVYAIPNATATLFFVEGGGQLGLPGLNWGDGFVTDTSLIRQYGLSDPNSFFRTLLTKPYLNNVGISPHVYPPSVTYATQGYVGSSFFFRMYNSFGYLNTVGYGGHLFPILVGEIGSKFVSSTDLQSLDDFRKWINAEPNTGVTHNKVLNVAYWDYNANSGDTGGIVDDSWVNILWTKVNWLVQSIQLQPWYITTSASPSPTPSSTPSTPAPTPSVTPAPTAAATNAPTPTRTASATPSPTTPAPTTPAPTTPAPTTPAPTTPAPTTPAPTSRPTVAATAAPTPTPISTPPRTPAPTTPAPTTPAPTTPAPSTTPAVTPSATPTPVGGQPCTASSTVSDPWSSGTGVYSSAINLFVQNTGSATIPVPYTVSTTGSYVNVQYSWNWNVDAVSNGTLKGVVNAGDYQTLQPTGNTVNFGQIADSQSNSANAFNPTTIAVNGVPCRIVPRANLQGS